MSRTAAVQGGADGREAMIAAINDLFSLELLMRQPWLVVAFAFQVWMFVDAVRREEWLWAVLIFFFSVFTAVFYYFLVYRSDPRPMGGFELPGTHDRKRIKELEGQIHHLDKAHHHSQLGDVYFQQGKLDRAEACYRAALEREPQDADTQAHLGQCLVRLGRVEEALPMLEKVTAVEPRHDYGHTLMALAEGLAQMGQVERAIGCWRRVLEGNAYARARVQLAELLSAQGQTEDAKALLNEVLADDAYAPAFQRRRDRSWIRRAKGLLKGLG